MDFDPLELAEIGARKAHADIRSRACA
jgi:hypothetical protein